MGKSSLRGIIWYRRVNEEFDVEPLFGSIIVLFGETMGFPHLLVAGLRASRPTILGECVIWWEKFGEDGSKQWAIDDHGRAALFGDLTSTSLEILALVLGMNPRLL